VIVLKEIKSNLESELSGVEVIHIGVQLVEFSTFCYVT